MKTVASAFAIARYLLIQEKCRICSKSIHPEIIGMDYGSYCPAASYKLNEIELLCDCLCRTCWMLVKPGQPKYQIFELVLPNGDSERLSVASALSFTGEAKKLILKFKYDGDLLLARDLAMLSLDAWEELASRIELSAGQLVPVPLHRKRLQERGFNQSELIARQLSKLVGVKISTKAITRIRKTVSQQQLGKLERLTNVKNAFRVNPGLVEGRQIVLIDDVCTSGATLLECALTLADAGAAQVMALTVARVD